LKLHYRFFSALMISLSLFSVSFSTAGYEHVGLADDIVKLSEKWWGLSFEKFPSIAGLNYGDYSQGDHPSRKGIKVIMPKKIEGKWAPKELPPLEFDFTDDKGLIEITGFYPGTQSDVMAVLIDRYGKPTRQLTAIGMTSYVWEFDKSDLELTPVSFSLRPKTPPGA